MIARERKILPAVGAALLIASGLLGAEGTGEEGFAPLFNGKDLSGWTGSTEGYAVQDGAIVCAKGGNLFTEKEYGDFVLLLEFKLPPGGNNGVGIRAPLQNNAAYAGMEIQVLDDPSPKYKDIKPWQHCGSVYGVVPAEPGHLKPTGEWNSEEITAKGRRITVILNGAAVVDADLDKASANGTADGKEHPGLKRASGHVAFLGHGSPVEFRNIRVKDLSAEAGEGPGAKAAEAGPPAALIQPPKGFVALFNGKDLTGWKGLLAKPLDNPIKRAQLTPDQLAAEQAKADEKIRAHWKAENGELVYDGKGFSLATGRDYRDFEMLVDWKIEAKGDSGIYLRGTPQVQIWDPAVHPEGSGGLFNNKINPSKPTSCADKPIGEWNTFRIKMVGERVTVWLNGVLVVDNVVMENYWDRNQPIFPTGQIELQHHGSTLRFRNLFIREISG